MAQHVADRSLFHAVGHNDARTLPSAGVARIVVPMGRLLFAAIFLMSVPNHFSAQTIEHAASQGVPLASIAVPASGVLELVGALSILFGFYARIGAWLLVLFLVPVTLMMHPFWSIADQQAAFTHQIMFLKNLSLLGAALLLTYFGAGPVSLDSRRAPQR